MADDKTKRHPQDGKRIDINDPNEVRNWCATFGCTANQLKNAVKAVGTSSEAVRKHLGK
jgi:hypothetical protein